ncbi:MAG: 4Fe-4S dicluster domain-containing protein [Oceanicaulis sp.]
MPATGKRLTLQRRTPGEGPDAPGPEVSAEAGATRREALALSSLGAMAALSACGDPPEQAVPYVREPDGVTPSQARFYATGFMLSGVVQPVLATVREGRPVTLAGNPDHPASRGAADPFTLASILGLYDPERETAVRREGRIVPRGDFERMLIAARARWAAGAKLRILTGASTSPTLHRQIAALQAAYPDAARVEHEPAFPQGAPAGPRLAEARTLISFGADPLGPGPMQTVEAARWADLRRAARGAGEATQLLVAEAEPTLTGARADLRLPAREDRLEALANAVAGGGAGDLSALERSFVEAARRALRQGGAQVLAGDGLPMESRRRIEALGDVTAPATVLDYGEALAFETLLDELAAGEVDTLLVLDANPVQTAPGDVDAADLLQRAGQVIHASTHRNETSLFADWFVPLAHPYESWSDGQAGDGRFVVTQPLARPNADVFAPHEILERLLDQGLVDDLSVVRETWRARLPAPFEPAWMQAVHDGIAPGAPPSPTPNAAQQSRAPQGAGEGAFEILIRPDPGVWDGRFAGNIWLQELPRPLSKTVWRNAAQIAPADAARLELEDGDLVRVAAGEASVEAPVSIQPGLAPGSVVVTLGYGRRLGDGETGGRGYDAYALRTLNAPWRRRGQLEPLGGRADLVTTQHHHAMDGHHFVRTVEPGEAVEHGLDDGASLYPGWEGGEYEWAMAIDLDLCIGCNACMTACQIENNISVVGEEEVDKGREMHWIRVDRYYEGPDENPDIVFQPVTCMHCEQAPCEMGCPVNATVHSDSGLNLQVYNRCIGTRTCQAYCPYKVRRFNFHDYAAREPSQPEPRRNPEVTVRARGVMEKCTYCVQRIQAADIQARIEDRGIEEGEVVTACQAACPTGAIIFGDQSKPQSAVAQAKREPRAYDLLAELGVRPRTSYLARVSTRARDDGGDGGHE